MGERLKVDGGNPHPVFTEPEGLGKTIEIADLERDTEAVARIFSQRSAIPHLAGVAPQMLDETEYQALRRQYNIPILAATSEGVRGYYRRNRGEVLWVARQSSENVVGTATLQRQGVGVAAYMVGRVAVEENWRRQHVARDLVITVCDTGFKNENISQIDASIIAGIEGYQAPLLLFQRLGFTILSEQQERALSWDFNENNFVLRPVLRLVVYRDNYLVHRAQILSS